MSQKPNDEDEINTPDDLAYHILSNVPSRTLDEIMTDMAKHMEGEEQSLHKFLHDVNDARRYIADRHVNPVKQKVLAEKFAKMLKHIELCVQTVLAEKEESKNQDSNTTR